MASADSTGDAPHAYARLRQAMAPDPSRWYYTGRVNDTGEYGESNCACGHEIRYEFIIACEDDDRTLIIGSTCIETNVPALIRDGAGRLAAELDEARRKLQRDLAGERRDLQAEEALAELHSDFRRLRSWCFERRKEWQNDVRYGRMPKVLHWIEQLPEDDETPSRYAAAIRRRYVSMWLKAAQILSTNQELFADAEPMPIPAQPRLFAQLASSVGRTANDWRSSNRRGAALAIRDHRALREVVGSEQSESRVVAGEDTASPPGASLEDSSSPGASVPVAGDARDSRPSEDAADRGSRAVIVSAMELERFLAELDELDLPGVAKLTLAEVLRRDGSTARVAAIESVEEENGTTWVILHLPSHHGPDAAYGEESRDAAQIGSRERWHEAVWIHDTLSLAWPSLVIYLASRAGTQEPSYHAWHEYLRRYEDPPDYLAILWDEHENDDVAAAEDQGTPGQIPLVRW
jgi:hypothetical protein